MKHRLIMLIISLFAVVSNASRIYYIDANKHLTLADGSIVTCRGGQNYSYSYTCKYTVPGSGTFFPTVYIGSGDLLETAKTDFYKSCRRDSKDEKTCKELTEIVECTEYWSR